MRLIKRDNAVVIAGDSLAIDDTGARAQAGQRLDDQREAVSEVVAWTTIKPHSRAVLPGNYPKAIVLDLVQPLAAGGQLIGFGWEARCDEPGRVLTRRWWPIGGSGAYAIRALPDLCLGIVSGASSEH